MAIRTLGSRRGTRGGATRRRGGPHRPRAGPPARRRGGVRHPVHSPAALERLVTLAIEDQPLPNGIAARAAVIPILASGEPERADRLRAAIRARVPLALHAATLPSRSGRRCVASDVGEASGREASSARCGVTRRLCCASRRSTPLGSSETIAPSRL